MILAIIGGELLKERVSFYTVTAFMPSYLYSLMSRKDYTLTLSI
ncbi:hypothetical protein MNB_SM-6-1499 [hydrothermal vent metagenome]|uniref:Uncharacterized protein n=1 Tax=hydrothermal vent metagenome TaxID=652676 RepID=A0A1W1CR02_9ZZZZ